MNEEEQPPWGYHESNGPSLWAERYPKAGGQKQSPIDITTCDAVPDPQLNDCPLHIDYDGSHTTGLVNTGAGWRVDCKAQGINLYGGPLANRYQIVQFHSHWGTCSKMGSEHTVDGKHYAGELHLVHYNTELYNKPSEAVCSEKGLSVIAIFLKEGALHKEMRKVTDAMSNVVYRGMKCPLSEINIQTLIPENSSYWTYEGSLTTPPCYESVTWIVFKDPIELSAEQFEAFRQLMSYKEGEGPRDPTDGPVLKNFRPPQPLMGRVIREPAL